MSLGWGDRKWAVKEARRVKGSEGRASWRRALPPLMASYPLSLWLPLPRHDVVEVAGLTSFSFGEDDECRYVMIFKKVKGPS